MSDVEIHKRNSIAVIFGTSDKGKRWIRDNIATEGFQYQVQSEFVWEIKQYMELEGLTVDIL